MVFILFYIKLIHPIEANIYYRKSETITNEFILLNSCI